MEKAQLLAALVDELKELQDPSLNELSPNLVPSEGNPDSPVMFVGEAPGRDEDRQRRPFVGAAGRLLTRAIEAAGWRRGDIYITNVVKRRPPENRPPRRKEVVLFRPYLMQEISIVNPKVVCLLGATAVKAILDKPLTEVLGQVLTRDGITYFCTYHPAAAIYNISLEDVFIRHIAQLKTIVGTWPETEIRPAESTDNP